MQRQCPISGVERRARPLCRAAGRFGFVALQAALCVRVAGAEPAGPDPAAIWTLQGENASISTASLSDRYYTNGLRLGWTSPEGTAPGGLEAVGRAVWGEGRQRIAVDITQQIYTPRDNQSGYPPLTDRPYAGVLLGTVTLLHDSGTSLGTLGLSLGLVGPSALGEPVQNGFHELIGQKANRGWDTQLHDQPLFQVTARRVWRIDLPRVGDMEMDALPTVAGGAGLRRIYALAGAAMRIGDGLDSDYGPARLPAAPGGTDVFRPTGPFAWYVFAGAYGQAVAHDVTLNGNLWHESRNVTLNPWVGEMQVGLAMMFSGVRITYTQVFQTQEFRYQKGGLHQLGSLAVSVRF